MENKKLKSHYELCELSKQFELGFDLQFSGIEKSLKLSNHGHPFSLMENEANIVYDIIINNNLQYGNEIATAFGVSSAAIGQALKLTNGLLVTMDSYIEEIYNDCNKYTMDSKIINLNSDGRKMAKKLYEFLEIENHVISEVGWSPDDVDIVISKHFLDKKLDFAFIDGGHFGKQIDADVKSIINYMKDDFIIFFHDSGCVLKTTWDFLSDNGFKNFKNFQTKFGLTAISRGSITI